MLIILSFPFFFLLYATSYIYFFLLYFIRICAYIYLYMCIQICYILFKNTTKTQKGKLSSKFDIYSFIFIIL